MLLKMKKLLQLFQVISFFSATTSTLNSLSIFDALKSIRFLRYGSSSSSTQSGSSNYCVPGEKFAIVVHGWRESCKEEWVGPLLSNLSRYRGGCVMCMDFAMLSNVYYPTLVHRFPLIVEALAIKLQNLQHKGYKPEDGYLFGFSYGSHVVLHAAIKAYGFQQLGEIDVCEPTGLGFEGTIRMLQNVSLAAQNVQCIHTSSNLGIKARTCHQDWNMGQCGNFQVGAGRPPKGEVKTCCGGRVSWSLPCCNHGLCPYFYNSAFTNSFYAKSKPTHCNNRARDVEHVPKYFQMGYRETRKRQINGILYADTFANKPYNAANKLEKTKNSNFNFIQNYPHTFFQLIT